jgi:hypothetical protein
MRLCSVQALLASLLTCATARADEVQAPPSAPVLRGSNLTLERDAPGQHDLLVFKGTLLFNEFVYRSVLRVPPNAEATPQTAKALAAELAVFLRDAGYDLAKVRAQVKGDQIEIHIDEGALDKVILVGAGWISALRFRAALNMPLDVFNRRLFEQQMPRLAKQFGFRGYDFELWPVHLLEADNAALLDIEELRAMPLLRPARGYELRIFAKTEAWGSGFSPEVILNGSIGFGAGGRYKWKDLLQDGDRWQVHFRLGGSPRNHLPPDGGSYFVNSTDRFSARWLSKPWGGSGRGLRMTIAPRLEFWQLQRGDLNLESYRTGVLDLGTGAGSQLSPEFLLLVTVGWQRRWIFDAVAAKDMTFGPDVAVVPPVSNRVFLRINSQYTFNPGELRQDLRNFLSVELTGYRPTVSGDSGYLRIDLQGLRIFALGWHELRLGANLSGEVGNIWFVDEVPLADHLRIGFGLQKYSHGVASVSLEFRYSVLRDKVKLAVFNDTGVWHHLPRDPDQHAQWSGSSGAGLCLFLFDELQLDAYYGVGWSTDSAAKTGIALAIKEAF